MTEFLNFSHFRSLVTLDHLFFDPILYNRDYFNRNRLEKHDGKQIRYKGNDIRQWDLCAVTETKFVLGFDADWQLTVVV